MTISGLSYDEKLGLVALLEVITMSDGVVEDTEIQQINKIAEEIGEEEYRELLNDADERFRDIEMLKESVKTIKERGARELIYGLLLEEAMNAPAPGSHTELLDWLKDTWEIEVKEAE